MRLLPRAATLAALVILCVPGPNNAARAAEAHACVTLEAVATQVRRQSASAEIRVITGLEAANLSAGLSAATRSTVPVDSTYVLAREPGSPLTYVVQFAAGCAAHHGRFPDQWVRAWIKGTTA